MNDPKGESLQYKCVANIVSHLSWEETQKMMLVVHDANMTHFLRYLKEQLKSKTTDEALLAWIEDIASISGHYHFDEDDRVSHYVLLFTYHSSSNTKSQVYSRYCEGYKRIPPTWTHYFEYRDEYESLGEFFDHNMIRDIENLYEACFVAPTMQATMCDNGHPLLMGLGSPYLDGTFPSHNANKRRKK